MACAVASMHDAALQSASLSTTTLAQDAQTLSWGK